jgi:hypothetical protein
MRQLVSERAARGVPIDAHLPFDVRNLGAAPAMPGVYLLYRGHRLIYIGLAAAGGTIRDRLRHHLRGDGGRCTRSATEFDYEASIDPVPLYRHYVAVYLAATGGVLPDCNEDSAR